MHTREEQLESFGRLLDVLDQLREKCPWDHIYGAHPFKLSVERQ